MIQFVNGGPEHIPVIQEIAEKTWWPTYSSMLEKEQIRYMLDTIYGDRALTDVIQDGSQEFVLLSDTNGYQGFASFGLQRDDPAAFKLHKLYVLPENQGKAYGTALIEEVKRRLIARNIRTLDLNVARKNPAKTFYERIGFQVMAEKDIPFGPYWLRDFIMRINF